MKIEQYHIVSCLDGLPPSLHFGAASWQAKVNALRDIQSNAQEELDTLLPPMLDKGFKGEL